MTVRSLTALALLIIGAPTQAGRAQVTRPSDASSGSNTVHVAKPTGVVDADRASILAALKQVQPGGTIQFAPGTYLVGEMIRGVAIPRLTLVGHPEGTTLRGCEPAAHAKAGRELNAALAARAPGRQSGALDSPEAAAAALRRIITGWTRCGMFELTGGHGTVRNLTFEYTQGSLRRGAETRDGVTEGGYLIESNTFRDATEGISPGFLSSAPTTIRGNKFINTFHAVSARGGHLHVLNNDISVPDPARLTQGHPGSAIAFSYDQNVIEGNRIEGHPDGIQQFVRPGGGSSRRNVIRDNTIIVKQDSTVVGIPLSLANAAKDLILEDNLVEGNRIVGGRGLGIEIRRGSGTKILNNTITGITQRDPFPGNAAGNPELWRAANGSGIWISSGSEENEIAGNTFERIAAYAIVLEGDRNRVETRAEDTVRDMGKENRIAKGSGRTPR